MVLNLYVTLSSEFKNLRFLRSSVSQVRFSDLHSGTAGYKEAMDDAWYDSVSQVRFSDLHSGTAGYKEAMDDA